MSLNSYVNHKVVILTTDGRTLVGTLLSIDQVNNLVLQDTVERVIRQPDDDQESEESLMGLYLLRGDSVLVVGKVNEELDASIDWRKVRGEEIGGIKHER